MLKLLQVLGEDQQDSEVVAYSFLTCRHPRTQGILRAESTSPAGS